MGEEYEEREEKVIDKINENNNNAYAEATRKLKEIQYEMRKRAKARNTMPNNKRKLSTMTHSHTGNKNVKGHSVNSGSSNDGADGSSSNGSNKRTKRSMEKNRRSSKGNSTTRRRRNNFAVGNSYIDDIHFVLRRHPADRVAKKLAREYLRTSKRLKVLHLKKFLRMKLGCHNSSCKSMSGSINSNTSDHDT